MSSLVFSFIFSDFCVNDDFVVLLKTRTAYQSRGWSIEYKNVEMLRTTLGNIGAFQKNCGGCKF